MPKFGVDYRIDGKLFGVNIEADTEEMAEKQVASMPFFQSCEKVEVIGELVHSEYVDDIDYSNIQKSITPTGLKN